MYTRVSLENAWKWLVDNDINVLKIYKQERIYKLAVKSYNKCYDFIMNINIMQ